jgi:hypothetical protein
MKTIFIAPGKECSHAWELMPWILQDSATEEEQQWLFAHVAKCPSCSAEFAQQSRLSRALALPPAHAPDPALGLQRLLSRIDAPQPAVPPVAAHRERRAGSWALRALAAVALVQAIGLGAMGLKLSAPQPQQEYRTLSSAQTSPTQHDAIRVVPDASMTVAQWDRLLRLQQLQVVGGPNAMGAYTVVSAQPASLAPPEQTVQQLRATPGIRLAERIWPQ